MHQALPFDTYETIKRLKAVGFTEQQAEAQTRMIAELVDEQLVTKAFLDQRLQEIEKSLKESIAESKAETIKWVAGLLLAQGAVIATLAKLL